MSSLTSVRQAELEKEEAAAVSTDDDDDEGDELMTPSPRKRHLPGDQKVSPIPDMVVQNRNVSQDEFIIVACDGIWDVQTNYEGVKTVADLFEEGEPDVGLVCEEVRLCTQQCGVEDLITAEELSFGAPGCFVAFACVMLLFS